MKLHTAPEVVSTFAPAEQANYSIKASGKAIRLLVDGIYTNKIRAAIRELMSNAFDAHIAAGVEWMPFDMHLPTLLDPTFRIRDYGVSMSHEDCMGLYTRFFDSTKDDTDDQVGAFGLGSKAPFAYSDQFTVIARKDGRKRTYLAVFGGEAMPTFGLVSDIESDEAQGLEISFPCHPNDRQAFERETRSLAIGFDPVPDVDGLELEVPTPAYVPEDQSFAVFTASDIPYEARVLVRQGCVIYPVDNREMTGRLRDLVNENYKVVLDVPIGSVQIAASREALSLDEQTVSYMRDACEAAATTLCNEVESRADACSTQLEALRFWFRGGNTYKNMFTITPKYKGKVLRTNILFKDHPSWQELKAEKASGRRKNREMVTIDGLDFTNLDNVKFILRDSSDKVIRERSRINAYVDALPYSGKMDTYVVTNMTLTQRRIIQTTTGLRSDRFVKAADLTDPGPPAHVTRRTRLKGELSGVTDVTNGLDDTPVKLTELPEHFLWIRVQRTTEREVNEKLRGVNQIRMFDQSMTDYRILCFTEGAAGRLDPDAAFYAPDLVTIWWAENRQKVVDAYADVVYDGACKELSITNEHSPAYARQMAAAQRMCNQNYTLRYAGEAEAKPRVKALEKKYPLLFDRRNEDAKQEYIEMCNNRTQQNGPTQ